MRIVIDTNTLSLVFNEKNQQHQEYKPVLKCLTNGEGVMTYGGTCYLKELALVGRIRKIILERQKAREIKIDFLEKKMIDREESRIKKIFRNKQFNDHHIVAIAIMGRCKIICSNDTKAIPLFKNRDLYPNSFKVPKIYSRSKHSGLLREK